MRNIPDEAMSGVVNDTILAKPPPLLIPAFAGMTVVQGSQEAGTLLVRSGSDFVKSRGCPTPE